YIFYFAFHNDFPLIFVFLQLLDSTSNFTDYCLSFWITSFEEFLNTRETLCYVVTCNPTIVECTHGKLCTRFTDGLCSNNSYRLADFYISAWRSVTSVTLLTYAMFRITSKG